MSAVTVGTTSSSYVYSAVGQLIEKNVGGTVTILMYDEAGHLLGEYTSTGGLIQETVWMGDIPVATLRPNGSGISIYYVHTDQLNAPRKIIQPSSNTLAWRWDTDPFGTAAPNQNPGGLGTFVYNSRFPGQYYQAETGLNYNYARDYDPQTGRYVESDPIGLAGGSYSTYAYANNSPLSLIDSTGLCPDKDKCEKLGKEIDRLANAVRVNPQDYKGLAQRFRNLRNLIKYNPSEVPGHAEQIDIRQRELRTKIQEYIDAGCGDPPTFATDYASMPIPSIDPQTQQNIAQDAAEVGVGAILLRLLIVTGEAF